MLQILKQIAKIGIKSESAPAPAEENVAVERLSADIARVLGRALTIRPGRTGRCSSTR